jgi:hypothetical protein
MQADPLSGPFKHPSFLVCSNARKPEGVNRCWKLGRREFPRKEALIFGRQVGKRWAMTSAGNSAAEMHRF